MLALKQEAMVIVIQALPRWMNMRWKHLPPPLTAREKPLGFEGGWIPSPFHCEETSSVSQQELQRNRELGTHSLDVGGCAAESHAIGKVELPFPSLGKAQDLNEEA